MIIKDMFTKEFFAKYGDVDVYNDVTDEQAPAFSGQELTPEGLEHYKEVLELEVEIHEDTWRDGSPYNYVIVKVDDCVCGSNLWHKYWGMANELFCDAAGYCTVEEYERYFREIPWEVEHDQNN